MTSAESMVSLILALEHSEKSLVSYHSKDLCASLSFPWATSDAGDSGMKLRRAPYKMSGTQHKSDAVLAE